MDFEGKRVDVNFFRIGPQREKSIRERYDTEAFLNMHHDGEDNNRHLVGRVRLTQGQDGLWKGHWEGDGELRQVSRLNDMTWEQREHLRGVMNRLQRELLDLDVHDALQLVGRHEGHHLHRHVVHMTCSCDDDVVLTVWTGTGSLAKATCEDCGKQGVLLSRRRKSEDD